MIHKVPRSLRANARSLRRAMTGPEQKLWARLKAHRLMGAQFRRQTPFDHSIADFACHAAKLVIEIDGDQHGAVHGLRRDGARDAWFEAAGYRVLRFSNWQVLHEVESVLLTIEAAVVERRNTSSLPSP